MRVLAAAGALLFALSGCTATAEPPEDESSSSVPDDAGEVDLAAICQALGAEEVLPGQDTVGYAIDDGEPEDGPGQQIACGIEPEDGYAEVAAEVDVFGTTSVAMAWHTPQQLEDMTKSEYEMAAPPADFLTQYWTDPLRDEVPCQAESCEDGINGYLHSNQYEALVANVSVEVRIDIFTTDLDADDARGFRDDADKALRAYLDAVAAQVK